MDQLIRKWVYFSKVIVRRLGRDETKTLIDKVDDLILHNTDDEGNIVIDPNTPIERDDNELMQHIQDRVKENG